MKELSPLDRTLVSLFRAEEDFRKNGDNVGLGQTLRQRAEVFLEHGFLHYALTEARNSQEVLQAAGADEEVAFSRAVEEAVLARLGKGTT